MRVGALFSSGQGKSLSRGFSRIFADQEGKGHGRPQQDLLANPTGLIYGSKKMELHMNKVSDEVKQRIETARREGARELNLMNQIGRAHV